jgi:uncharacterized membrane protein YuzA (DUF378 family)
LKGGEDKMKKMNFFDWLAIILLVVGGLNWGLVGFFGFNLVGAIFGEMGLISRIIYALVGLSAIYVAVMPTMLEREECEDVSSMKGSMRGAA